MKGYICRYPGRCGLPSEGQGIVTTGGCHEAAYATILKWHGLCIKITLLGASPWINGSCIFSFYKQITIKLRIRDIVVR